MQNEPPASDRPQFFDRNGHPVLTGDHVIITGSITGQNSSCVNVRLDGSTESDYSEFSVEGRFFIKGEINDRVPGPAIVAALQQAQEVIRALGRRLERRESEGKAREKALRETIVQIVASGRPSGINGCYAGESEPYPESVAKHLDSLIVAISTPPHAAERKPTPQQCADMEFQAGREIFRRGAQMMDDASDDARYGYEYEQSVTEGRAAVESEGGSQA